MSVTVEIISYDRRLLHTDTVNTALPIEDLLVEQLTDFAEAKSIPTHELDGMTAVGWPTSDPTDKAEVYGSEWRN